VGRGFSRAGNAEREQWLFNRGMAVGKRAGQVVNLLAGGRENDGSDAFGLISRMGGGDGLYVILGGWVLGIEGPASLHEMYHRPTVRFYIQKRYIRR
jgi:hypothetical protein